MQQSHNTEGQKVDGERFALDTCIKIGKPFDINLLHNVTLSVHCLGLLKQNRAMLRIGSRSADMRLRRITAHEGLSRTGRLAHASQQW